MTSVTVTWPLITPGPSPITDHSIPLGDHEIHYSRNSTSSSKVIHLSQSKSEAPADPAASKLADAHRPRHGDRAVTDPNARATQPGNRNAGVQVTSIKFKFVTSVTVGALPRLTELTLRLNTVRRHRRRRVAESRPHQFGLRDDSVVTARLTNVTAWHPGPAMDGPSRRKLDISDRCL